MEKESLSKVCADIYLLFLLHDVDVYSWSCQQILLSFSLLKKCLSVFKVAQGAKKGD